jgi:hypothetical protein
VTFEVDRPLGHLDKEACPHCKDESSRVFEVFEKPPEIGGGACSSHGGGGMKPMILEE